MAVVSWGEKETFTKGVSDDQNKERGGDGENISPFAPPPSDASISKSYVAGWINDRELLKVNSS